MWRVVHAMTLTTMILLGMGQAQAIEGGASARAGDLLAGATVAVRAVDLESRNRIGLTHCSGVLIAADLVVTAAHCIPTDKKLAALWVFFYQGSQASREPVMVTDVVRRSGSGTIPLIPMDDLQSRIGRLGSDFAILRLAHPVVDRRPIPVANSSQRTPTVFRLAGVGISGRVAGTLRTASLKTAFELGSPRLAVANAVGARVCLGDSGGPAVIRDRNGGVFLWGIATAVITPRGPCGSIVVVTPVALEGIESK
jgi:Trypsin